MEELQLSESEYRFALIVWENEPIGSGALVKLCNEQLGWKKSTTYTVLKKLCNRNIIENKNATVQSLVKKDVIEKFESEKIIHHTFNGSLPRFIAAFINDKKISAAEAEELKALIEKHKED